MGAGLWMEVSVGLSGDFEQVSSGQSGGHVLVFNSHDVVLVSGRRCCGRGDGCERVWSSRGAQEFPSS